MKSMHRVLPALLGILAACCSLRHAPDNGMKPVAFVGANVISMENDAVADDQTIVIRGREIAQLGRRDSVRVPDDAIVIPSQGRFLIPGLADAHAHLPGEGGQPYDRDTYLFLNLARGVTTLRAMRGTAEQLALKRQIESGSVEGPNLLVSCPPLTDDEHFSRATIDEIVPRYKKEGYDFIKLLGGVPQELYEPLVAAAKRNGILFMGHVPRDVGLARAIAAGQDDVEHVSPILAAWLADPAAIEPLIAKMSAQRIGHCPDVDFYEIAFHQRELDALQKSTRGLEYVDHSMVRSWTDELTKQRTESEKKYQEERTKWAGELTAYMPLLQKMNQAGVPLLVSGSDGEFIVPGFSMLDEMEIFPRAGLTPYDVLRAATRNVAEVAGQEQQWGTIAKGKRADLVLLDGNPLDDLHNVEKIAGVMVRGRWIPKSEIDTKLQEIAKKAAVR